MYNSTAVFSASSAECYPGRVSGRVLLRLLQHPDVLRVEDGDGGGAAGGGGDGGGGVAAHLLTPKLPANPSISVHAVMMRYFEQLLPGQPRIYIYFK